MRRFVNMAKSGRMAATRRVQPVTLRPLRKNDTITAGKRRVSVPGTAGKRRG
jgi:hypothetical protein